MWYDYHAVNSKIGGTKMQKAVIFGAGGTEEDAFTI